LTALDPSAFIDRQTAQINTQSQPSSIACLDSRHALLLARHSRVQKTSRLNFFNFVKGPGSQRRDCCDWQTLTRLRQGQCTGRPPRRKQSTAQARTKSPQVRVSRSPNAPRDSCRASAQFGALSAQAVFTMRFAQRKQLGKRFVASHALMSELKIRLLSRRRRVPCVCCTRNDLTGQSKARD